MSIPDKIGFAINGILVRSVPLSDSVAVFPAIVSLYVAATSDSVTSALASRGRVILSMN